jgi:fructose-bisphosphate aldolase / 2-amino-3,7-dideoxy-D-threo-hept-6-ulosonate synthase
MTGKQRHMRRLFSAPHNRCLMAPLDHGGWLGPVTGIRESRKLVRGLVAGGVTALLVTPGFWRDVAPDVPTEVGIALRVSLTGGLSPRATQETPIATVESALRLDADAVAASIFFGRDGDLDLLRYLGELVETAARYDLPVLAEVMPPGEKSYNPDAIAHAARIGYELGADIIKTNYSGDADTFRRVLEAVGNVPIIIAGGPAGGGDDGTVASLASCIAAGAAGVAFGRRVWQAADPEQLMRRMAAVMAEDATPVGLAVA